MLVPANAVQFELLVPSAKKDLKVLSFNGTEAISTLYAFNIELVSEYAHFDLETLLRQPAFLRYGPRGEGIHGRIENVAMGEPAGRLARYHLTLVPVLHYLQFSRNQRIFQRRTVPEIITEVLKGHGILSNVFTFHVTTSPAREYCTQYGESDFEFVQRLCSEDGIAWHHRHAPDGHELVFTDHQMYFQKLGTTPYRPGYGLVAEHPVVSRFALRFNTRTSTATRHHYNFERPHVLRKSQATTPLAPALEDYRSPAPSHDPEHGEQLARYALERHRTDCQVVEGQSDEPGLRSGHLFELTEHPRKQCNAWWLLLSVTHVGRQPQVLEEQAAGEAAAEHGFAQGYHNCFAGKHTLKTRWPCNWPRHPSPSSASKSNSLRPGAALAVVSRMRRSWPT